MPVSRWKSLQKFGLLLVCCALTATAGAETTPPDLPVWRTLEFMQKAYGTTARSQVTVSRDAVDARYWQLDATSSIAGNAETVRLRLEPESGRVLDRSRLSRGRRDQRYKRYHYLPDHVLRERLVPGNDPNLVPDDWNLTSRLKIPYPPGQHRVITGNYALLLLAGRLTAGGMETAEVLVHTDHNFYSVSMRLAGNASTPVNYRLAGEPGKVTGERPTRAVVIIANGAGQQRDKPDFDLLGLSGRITVWFDALNGLPVMLSGAAPRVGSAELKLRQATLREPRN